MLFVLFCGSVRFCFLVPGHRLSHRLVSHSRRPHRRRHLHRLHHHRRHRSRDLHQWGNVTLFHGLPSDRVRAIAQTPDGAMWFGTETGLAKFDGRRTQTINDRALPTPGRILALQTDKDGAMWIGTDSGALRYNAGEFIKVNETSGQTITAIVTDQSGSAFMTSAQGRVYESRARVVTTVNPGITDSETTTTSRTVIDTRELLDQSLQSSDREHPGPLSITSINVANGRIFIGTHSRGVLEIANGAVQGKSDETGRFLRQRTRARSRRQTLDRRTRTQRRAWSVIRQ